MRILEQTQENINLIVKLLEKSYKAAGCPNTTMTQEIGTANLYYLNSRGTEYIKDSFIIELNNKGVINLYFLDAQEVELNYNGLSMLNGAEIKNNEKIRLDNNVFLKVVELLNHNIKTGKKESKELETLKLKLESLKDSN